MVVKLFWLLPDSCLVHTSLVAGLSIAGLFLRLLLDPGPWPEQHGLAQILQMDGIPAEEKFHAFRYLEWVHDTDIAVDQGASDYMFPDSTID